MKTVFVYDEDGFYCGTHIAQLNPRNKSSWLMPPHSTNVDPNDEDGFFFKIKDPGNPESGWDKIPYPSTAEDFLALNIPHESRTKRNNDLRRLLSQFAQNDPEHYREVSVNDESGKKIATKLEVIPEPTPEELKEQDKLRKEYIKLFREGFKSQLKAIKVVDEKGNDITPLKLKQEKLKN